MARVNRTPTRAPSVRVVACILAMASVSACRKDDPTPSSTAADPGDPKAPDAVPDPVVVAPRFDRIVPRE